MTDLDLLAEETRLREAFDALTRGNARLRTELQQNIQQQYELRGAFALLTKMKAGHPIPAVDLLAPSAELEGSDG